MKKRRKRRQLNKIRISAIIILIVTSLMITVFGRYIYNNIKEAYVASKQFYFTSNILTEEGSKYVYDNWGGQSVYKIELDLYSYENSISKLNYDLEYEVTCSTPDTDKVKCTINSYGEEAQSTGTGKIKVDENHTSSVIVYVEPIGGQIAQGDSVTIEITASTTKPYKKTVSTEITLTAAMEGNNTYSIEDVTNRDYVILKLTCPSDGTEVILEFDPTELRIDSNDEVYINRDTTEGATGITTIEESVEIEVENGNITTETQTSTYVNKITYEMPAETTKYVKFYKVDKTQNYTYPGGIQATSPIKVTMGGNEIVPPTNIITLAEITNDDIGQYIDLGLSLVGEEDKTTDDWRILWVDEEEGKVYAMLNDYLPNSTGYAARAGLNTQGTYIVNSTVARDDLINKLQSNYWISLATDIGIEGVTVMGGPTGDMLQLSYNYKNNTDIIYKNGETIMGDIWVRGNKNDGYGYWLNSAYEHDASEVWCLNQVGGFAHRWCTVTLTGLCPVVCLPFDTKADIINGIWTVTEFKLNAQETLKVGSSTVITTTINKSEKITWTSLNENIVSVSGSEFNNEEATIKGINAGTTIITATTASGITQKFKIKVLDNVKVSDITNDNIGKYIDLGISLVGTEATTDDWRILWVDEEERKVYAMLNDYLPNSTGYAARAGLNTQGTYIVNSTVARDDLINKLQSNYWISLATDIGIEGVTVMGGPTGDMLQLSYNYKNNTDIIYKNGETIMGDIWVRGNKNDGYGYWLNSAYEHDGSEVWCLNQVGEFAHRWCAVTLTGLCPVVCLPFDTKADIINGIWIVTE